MVSILYSSLKLFVNLLYSSIKSSFISLIVTVLPFNFLTISIIKIKEQSFELEYSISSKSGGKHFLQLSVTFGFIFLGSDTIHFVFSLTLNCVGFSISL